MKKWFRAKKNSRLQLHHKKMSIQQQQQKACTCSGLAYERASAAVLVGVAVADCDSCGCNANEQMKLTVNSGNRGACTHTAPHDMAKTRTNKTQPKLTCCDVDQSGYTAERLKANGLTRGLPDLRTVIARATRPTKTDQHTAHKNIKTQTSEAKTATLRLGCPPRVQYR